MTPNPPTVVNDAERHRTDGAEPDRRRALANMLDCDRRHDDSGSRPCD